MKRSGLFITVEGIDGAGKTTLLKRIAAWLERQGFPVILTKEPGGTVFGEHLRTFLQNEKINTPRAEFLLFAADRAHHIATVVQPALARGSIVLSDRCADSALAYQGYGRGLSIEIIQHINRWALDGVTPDCTLYLRIDPDTAIARMQLRNELTTFEKEQHDFWRRVIDGYETIAKQSHVATIDALQEKEIVFQEAQKALESLLQKYTS